MKKKYPIYRKPAIKSVKIKLNMFFNLYDEYDGYFNFIPEVNGELLACCGTCFSCSDRKLKNKLKPVKKVLEKIKRLQAYEFQWKRSFKSLGIQKNTDSMGLLAQDVKIAFPQLAKKINRNYLGVNYPAFTAILVEAIKELT